jgi:cation diffusion facilitator CzcD-associated flavoprotein CzcO
MVDEGRHVVIVGAGFAGLCMAIGLKRAGHDDFTLLEAGERVGGTWRDNDYPGAACDVRSHLYSFSFEPNPNWSRAYAPQAEILAYLERCVERYGLGPHLRLGARVEGAEFDERSGLWAVTTAGGGSLRARWLVSAGGGLNRPARPALPGLDAFEGPAFHSARWRHDVPLDGRAVAVVGTGASAIQIVPALAPRTGALYVFQRTAPWVIPRGDRAVGGGARRLYGAVPLAQRLARLAIYARSELVGTGFVGHTPLLAWAERQARAHLAASVPEGALRAKLTPDYRLGCKRVLLSDDYYRALRRPNVELVTEPVAEVRARSVVTADGRERPVDALVLATGFRAAEAGPPFAVRGRSGSDLGRAWARGPEAYLGAAVAGFPNLFFLVGPNTGLGHSSMVLMIEAQARYVLSCIEMMRAKGLKFVDVRPEVQARYNRALQRRLAGTVWASGCASWYRTSEGKITTLWPGYVWQFRRRTRRFDPADYELAPLDRGGAARAAAASAPAGLPRAEVGRSRARGARSDDDDGGAPRPAGHDRRSLAPRVGRRLERTPPPGGAVAGGARRPSEAPSPAALASAERPATRAFRAAGARRSVRRTGGALRSRSAAGPRGPGAPRRAAGRRGALTNSSRRRRGTRRPRTSNAPRSPKAVWPPNRIGHSRS